MTYFWTIFSCIFYIYFGFSVHMTVFCSMLYYNSEVKLSFLVNVMQEFLGRYCGIFLIFFFTFCRYYIIFWSNFLFLIDFICQLRWFFDVCRYDIVCYFSGRFWLFLSILYYRAVLSNCRFLVDIILLFSGNSRFFVDGISS